MSRSPKSVSVPLLGKGPHSGASGKDLEMGSWITYADRNPMTGVLTREKPRPRDHRDRGWRDVATTSRTPGATRSWERQAGPFLVPLPRPRAASLQHGGETIPAVSAVWRGVTCSSCSKKWVWSSWRRDSSCPSGPSRGSGGGSRGLARVPMLHPSLWPRNLARARHGQARILDPVGRSVPA